MSVLRVGLDARLVSGYQGGIEQFVIGLASGLSSLSSGDEEYVFLAHAGSDEWLRPYMNGRCRILSIPPGLRDGIARRIFLKFPSIKNAWHGFAAALFPSLIQVPRSDGTIERAGIDVMHFTHQGGFLTDIPSIYHPHDLQYLHLPQYFSRYDRLARDLRYRALCHQARTVAVCSSWVKEDLVWHYGLPSDKIAVIPLAPSSAAYPTPSESEISEIRRRLNLPETFVFYPAHTWPHKNHLGLIEALALLRDRHGLNVSFVSSGRITDFASEIRERASRLGLMDQIRLLGFVSTLELQVLYRLCRCVVVPTKFEAASFPLWEAFLAEAPAACSNVTSLPRQAGDSALIFDPDKPAEIAEGIRRLWTDDALRADLVQRGRKNVARFSWQHTARMFRAHYRRLAGRPLTVEDQALLEAPPLL